MLLYSLCKGRGNHLLSFTKVRLFLSSLTPLGIIYSFENSPVSSSRLWTPGFGQFTSFISFIWGWCLPVPICPPVHKASQKRCLRSLMESWPQPDKTTLGLIREETASQVFSSNFSVSPHKCTSGRTVKNSHKHTSEPWKDIPEEFKHV